VRSKSFLHQTAYPRVRRRIFHDGIEEEASAALANEDVFELFEEALRVLCLVAGLTRVGRGLAQDRHHVVIAGLQPGPELLIEVHRVFRANRTIELHGIRLDR
jgi:hypothetical protein